MKNIAVLGSTGSIGTQTLEVVRRNPELFHISVLAANSRDELFEQQIREFEPELAVLADEAAYLRLKSRYSGKTQLAGGRQAFIDAAAFDGVDTVVTSMMGFAGLEPTMKALDAKKNIALANKETLVVAGEIVTRRAKEQGVKILPVDSEHCAFFQCLQGEKMESIEKLLLTCSGGPFRGKQRADLVGATKEQVLAHPTWNMGQKITVDSASLVNKGLEVIEAKWLYDVSYDQIQVVVHPQSIVHSMVQFRDGAVIAQLGSTDMKLPIQYALTYPDRVQSSFDRLDFWQMKDLTFSQPDTETFKGLKFAYEAGAMGGSMPCVFNAANEVAVGAFLKDEIKFLDIYDIIEETMLKRECIVEPTLEELFAEDAWAREFARGLLQKK
ncbi:MAG: 1-deoxy-D-xylulose-5-phosphate reductoisomerase [Selenomonas sp.]|uniref:1-deoxy-D-xylulose-5-phosphate reductoisomerase n=1 Tax=Selenomonas sp. AE3005 TaxID=1485543 RepID=UPI00048053AD|nr:1-deoxy-D-xylulose-5-phosphate reductoisomerase [Selenomonas sp. AE3005]MBQ1613057.1 1-deoxy-D-xylulose-5-phosphate reductoisomerase [Selenomonas sp.]MBQ1920534.1 1-deoxy-D-xylulose-5-phosphate reductoisomerase [Selenomonas sp.]MBQ2087149.1 1-deoxy-D-xylulose-5-phosphate reductoisomerase [Selenomonas sp.]MBQ5420467.1 1-deoxy-D-xylulose-5-phosphate reductoisomerase [Selenomonas sp.]MBQ5502026.1 1-deoxy-D-xylulose-5-phosphate reductoisomerase [Selenomonas sp.]